MLCNKLRLSSNSKADEKEMVSVDLEQPLDFGGKKFDLVVCVGAMYIYTEWQILVTGMETWFALGASKIVFLIQSASNDTHLILKEYERSGEFLLVVKVFRWELLTMTITCYHFVSVTSILLLLFQERSFCANGQSGPFFQTSTPMVWFCLVE